MIASTRTTRIPMQGTPALVRNRTIRRARWTSSLHPIR
jgi:hypothetical protein